MSTKNAQKGWDPGKYPYAIAMSSLKPRDYTIYNCSNCRRDGHTLEYCMQPHQDGTIHGCPLCNESDHLLETCPNVPRDSHLCLFQLLVVNRNNKPPIATTIDWTKLPGFWASRYRPWTIPYSKKQFEKDPTFYETFKYKIDPEHDEQARDPAWDTTHRVKAEDVCHLPTQYRQEQDGHAINQNSNESARNVQSSSKQVRNTSDRDKSGQRGRSSHDHRSSLIPRDKRVRDRTASPQDRSRYKYSRYERESRSPQSKEHKRYSDRRREYRSSSPSNNPSTRRRSNHDIDHTPRPNTQSKSISSRNTRPKPPANNSTTSKQPRHSDNIAASNYMSMTGSYILEDEHTIGSFWCSNCDRSHLASTTCKEPCASCGDITHVKNDCGVFCSFPACNKRGRATHLAASCRNRDRKDG